MRRDEAGAALGEILELPAEEQAQRCIAFFGGRAPPGRTARCARRAREALARLEGAAPGAYLREAGIAVERSPDCPRYGGAALRARLDLEERRIVVYDQGSESLREALASFEIALPCDPAELVVAHELFHVLDPGCPEPLAEISAHFFAALCLGLPWYGGVADVAEALYRRTAGAALCLGLPWYGGVADVAEALHRRTAGAPPPA